VDLKYFKAFDSARQDIHPAVVIALRNFDDLCCATDVRDSARGSAHYAEGLLLIQALGDHFLVAWFKDMQRQRNARQ